MWTRTAQSWTEKAGRWYSGKVGYRASSKLMLAPAKVAEAIAALKALGRKELVKTTETLDREALKKEPPALLEGIGAYIRTRDESRRRHQRRTAGSAVRKEGAGHGRSGY